MAEGAIWKGYIHFNQIDVPVKLHAAVREERIQFHLLHGVDRTRLRQQMICAFEKVPVASGDQVKGFEVEDGKYIILDPEDLEKTLPGQNRAIEVHEFIGAGDLDPLFLGRSYHLEPDGIKSGTYNALAAALKETDTAGVCTWVMRKRSYLGALQVSGRVLCLSTLRYGDEVIPVASLGLQAAGLSEKELTVGSYLIEQMTGPFEPWKFKDEHQKRLWDLIDMKARGEKVAILPPRRIRPTPTANLLQTLEASLKKTG
jgi:DNA end-binding protein Ku